MALFLSSFLVLFLETALIRWMPAYVRLLAYFSNFILLASFLGIGVGCLLTRRRKNLFIWFPLIQFAVILAVDQLRLELALPSTSTIYFSSGTTSAVVPVESTLLLPLLFTSVAALFIVVAHRMGQELSGRPPLRAYVINLLGSLTGVAAFALVSWLELPPSVWFGVAAATALPFLVQDRRWIATVNVLLLAGSLAIVHRMETGSLWSPYYRITIFQDRADTVVEVNHIFHQSMAPVAQKEYFYQWPYTVFGDTFDDVLILGAGSGTDVAAALRHGAKHVTAVDIDPVILRLGAERHPDRPYSDPRVTVICDDARHFLRTATRRYDLVVFALIDSLTVQSSFSGVRLESYMFTKESFEAVRDHLSPRGVMVLYNYFREKWLVDRLANTLAEVFGREPLGHVHQDRAYLAVMLAGPRLAELTAPPPLPPDVTAYGQSHAPSPAHHLERDPGIVLATDNWPFLYMRAPDLPRHYVVALALVLFVSALAVWFARGGGTGGRWSWHFFFLGAGFMLLETKSIVQFALLWGSTWSSASLAIASVLVMALASALVAGRVRIRRRGAIAAALFALIAVNYLIPVGRVTFDSRISESMFYGSLVFSPVFCAGLLFSSSFRESSSAADDFGANLLGAMVGGVGEYLSLLAGYQFLLILVAVCYILAVVTRRREPAGLVVGV
ncbi:MAG TPA: methyltransferase domain-containing protein [Vicinamibacterales bacterium]|nr:methyltransferase domain-containing protein [Vicinamibacterales bacterium]